MKLTNIEIISIPVTDQDRSKAFYSEILGFKLLHDAEFAEGMRWVHLTPSDEAQTSITLVHWFDAMPAGSCQGLILLTEDLEEAHAELTAKGLEMEAIQEQPWGKFAGFKDPDGNGWSLRQVESE